MRRDTYNQPGHSLDGLLIPSLQSEPQGDPEKKPWRQGSQFYVAFLGGTMAYAIISYINGKRLGIRRDLLFLILLLGIIGMLGTICLGYWLGVTNLLHVSDSRARILRYSNRGIAVLVYLACSQIQKSADRIYSFRTNGNGYASLWLPGIISTVVVGGAQGILSYGILKVLGSL